MKKLILTGTLGIWIALTGLVGCGQKEEPAAEVVRPVKTMTLGDPDVGKLRSFPGRVIANKTADLSFQVTGELQELPILKGTEVKKGQLIARLDPKKFQDRVNEAKAKFTLAKVEYERASQLVGKGHISRSDYDKKTSMYQVTKANLSIAERDLAYTSLHAPFRGLIAKKYVDNFEHVNAAQPIVALQDVTNVDMEINVPENIMITVKQRRATRDFEAVFEALPNKRYPVTFKEFSSEADPETQTYSLIFTMLSPKEVNVLPGMTVTIQVKLKKKGAEETSSYDVPTSSVFSDGQGKTAVWIVDRKTMRVKKVSVQMTRLSSGNVRVLKGLKSGDVLVTAGVNFLKEGQKVRIMDDKKTP